MNLLKLINIRTPKQIDALVEETELIKQRCDKIASQEFKEQKENQRTHDSRCPLCRAEKNEIVDKIEQVEGEGNVSGNLFGVMGRMKIETKPVNHCNVCGHEWFKFKTKYISKRDILRVALKYLNDLIDNPEHNKRLSWKLEAIEVFEGCHAEAITMLVKEERLYMRYNKKLRNSVLRKYYPSIFDGENKKEFNFINDLKK